MQILARIARSMAALLLCAGALAGLPSAVLAQENPFSPAFTINGRVVSNYELTQRIIFFSLLQPDLDATTEARKSLIDDRLRQYAADQLGVTVSPEEVTAAMETFAARANLTGEEFIKALATRGVAAETFRDFVLTGVLWRETVRAKFLARTEVSEREIDRAIAGGIAAGGDLKLLLSEIVIKTGGASDALQLAGRIKGDVTSAASFANAARVYSVGPSARQGGVLDWAELSALPPAIAAEVAALQPGEVSEPIVMRDSVMLLYVRDRSSTAGEATGAMAVDYVRLIVAPQTDTAALRGNLDRCEDLLPLGRGLPEEAVLRETVAESALPGDLSGAIARLDAGESTAITTSGGQTAIVMLCARTPLTDSPPSRDDVRGQLLNQKMGLRALSYLEQLRAEALIVEN